ncbi:MAG: FGGY-family carbohydrate kinase [Chloroflexi bacterium]|nr:FGGY-family carbohydrate kinase [Chloroflexota bacterium]
MAGSCVLALDLGTTSAKALVADRQGLPAGFASRDLRYKKLPDVSPWAREFVPGAVLKVLTDLVAEALAKANASPADVAGIGITSQRQGVAFLDVRGREVYLGPNLDLRALFQGMAIDGELGPQVYETTGHLPSFFFAPAKLKWFQEQRPRVYERIGTVLPLADWLAFRLTGEMASQRSLAAEAGLVALGSENWAEDLMKEMGLEPVRWPPLLEAGQPTGFTTGDLLGLPKGIPVVVAGPDSQTGLLGMGVLREAEVGITAGWSCPVQLVTSAIHLDPARRTWAGLYLLPETYVIEASTGDGGMAYRWVRESFFRGARDPYSRMERLAAALPPGCEGVTAMLGPSFLDLSRVGLRLGGMLFHVPLTYNAPGPGHAVRAVLENIAYAIRAGVEYLEQALGKPARRFCLGGGLSRVRLLGSVLADVLGRPVEVASFPHVSATGAALAALVASGGASSLEEAVALWRPQSYIVEPDAAHSAEYNDFYSEWQKLWAYLQEREGQRS